MPKIKTKTKKRSSSSANSSNNKDIFLKCLIFSLACYVIVYLISCSAALIFDLNDNYDFYVSLISFSSASFCSGFYTGIKLRKNGLISGLVFTLPANLILILTCLIISDFKTDITLLITAVALLVSSALGGIVAVNKRHRR